MAVDCFDFEKSIDKCATLTEQIDHVVHRIDILEQKMSGEQKQKQSDSNLTVLKASQLETDGCHVR